MFMLLTLDSTYFASSNFNSGALQSMLTLFQFHLQVLNALLVSNSLTLSTIQENRLINNHSTRH